ncbi:hypothetical protein QNI16_37805 [Cytophagaceae bacterium YF14B1]|uniref:DUF4252 domain-containing protein n=1 Tax=Xanthocytophaga flava TaxID=3048013 RepID=A0AAE3QVL3_9BACT|nr:hypothetical protein [Xanthocytophaga flavus]MDJ1486297.1 hypothetical protein [Xanthocytophaga flavus]
MRKYTFIVWVIALLLSFYTQAQTLDQNRTKIAQKFVKDLFSESVSDKQIAGKYMYFHSPSTMTRDTMFRNMVEVIREQKGPSFTQLNEKYKIVPYKEASGYEEVEQFNNSDAEDDVYVVTSGKKAYLYIHFDKEQKERVISFITIKKGRNEPSIFFAL